MSLLYRMSRQSGYRFAEEGMRKQCNGANGRAPRGLARRGPSHVD